MIIESKYFSKKYTKEICGWRGEKSFPLVYPYMFFSKDNNYYMYAPAYPLKHAINIYKIHGNRPHQWFNVGLIHVNSIIPEDFVGYTVLNYNGSEGIPDYVSDGMFEIYDSVLTESYWIYDRYDKTIKRSNNREIPVTGGVLALPGDYSLSEVEKYFGLITGVHHVTRQAIVDLKQMNTDGRKICAKCQGPIKVLSGFSVSYNHCPICEP